MRVRTAVLWWLLNDKEHPSLKAKDKTIGAVEPLVHALFPGINYYSVTGFCQVMRECVMPVLKKRYPELLTIPEEKVRPRAMTEIAMMLPSKGYEWQKSSRWWSKFQKLLAVA